MKASAIVERNRGAKHRGSKLIYEHRVRTRVIQQHLPKARPKIADDHADPG